MNKKKYTIGFMQGRLSDLVDNMTQSFPWNNWEKEFSIANQNNLELIEWTLDAKNLYQNPLMNKYGRKKIKNLCERFNLKVSSLTGDCFMQEPFWKRNNPNVLKKEFIDICEAAAILGITYIVIPLVDNGSFENNSQKDLFTNYLLDQYIFLKKRKIKIIFESDLDPIRLKEFISNFPEDTFGINYDIGNSAALNYDSNQEFSAYGGRILNIHVKDRLKGGKTVPLGCGNADFKKVFNNIASVKYSGNLILQTARAENNNHLDVILKYKKFTEELIESLY